MPLKVFSTLWTEDFVKHWENLYLDDVLIFSSIPPEYLPYIEWVLNKWKEHYLFAQPTKCKMGRTELEYLSYIIRNNAIKPPLSKSKAISR